MEVARYFFDSYAVIELMKGNPHYARYVHEEVVITIFNLVEIYWSALNDLGESEADETYNTYKAGIADVEDGILKEAIKFRKKNKKRDLSYADCIGYMYAVKNNMKFLTGDKEFKNLEHVEFVQ